MFIVFVTIIALTAAAPVTQVNDSICETPTCIHTASSLLKNMDPSINPCNNFYKFACGKFIEETIIPDSESQVSIYTKLENKLEEQLRHSISDKMKEGDPPVFKVMRSFYKLCMDIDKIEKNSENDLRKILKKLGGWPVLEGSSWNEGTFDWKRFVYESGRIGYDTDIFVSLSIQVDLSDSNKRILEIDKSSTGVAHNYLINGVSDDVVKAYSKFMISIAEHLGADEEAARKELSDSLNFEIELAKLSLSNENHQDSSQLGNRMTLRQLEKKYSGIPWTEYINEILTSHAHIDQSEEISIFDPSFLEKLPQLIARTPKRVLANYACFRTIMQSVGTMGKAMQRITTVIQRSISGIPRRPPRWKKCLEYVSEYFFTAIGSLYVKRYFDKKAKSDAIDLIKNLQNSLHQLIDQANWMDCGTKYAALEKLQYMGSYIGYPDELDNDENINEIYQNIKLYPKSFLISQLKLKLFHKGRRISYLRRPVSETKWTTHSKVAMINAFYMPSENSIDFPAGILQDHFYSNERPNYMNYGAIGWVIGHEMTHAFDDDGSQYDKNGNLVDWWNKKTKEEYLKRAQCIIDQYSNYTVQEINMPIDGINTQGENIADNGGLKASYFAYDEWAKKNGKEPRLPGLHYTPHQMFWISAANNFCKTIRPEVLKLDVIDTPHSPSEFRIIGTMSNIPEFSKDFNCPLGSPMNPVKKCSVF